MDLYLRKEPVISLSTLTEPEIFKYSTDRIVLMLLCSDILKNQTACSSNTDLIALLNQELINTNQTELIYLISDDNAVEYTKKYLSWFILIAMCTVRPKHKDWVKEHELAFLTVFSTYYNGEQLQQQWFKLRNDKRRFDFATIQDIQSTDGFLDMFKTYVKVPYTQISKKLATIDEKIIRNGYLFVEYKPNIRDLFICLLEEEWDAIWHENVADRSELLNIDYFKIMDRIESFLYAKRASHKSRGHNTITDTHPISTTELPKMAEEYFPPCMSSMFQSFKEHGELKHDARKQLTLFLKDVGVPKPDIVNLVKINYDKPHLREKKMEVVYYMSHLLGVTGHGRNYSSYNCQQIQEHPVADGLAHGCYFKKTSKRRMENDLIKLGFSAACRNTIYGKVLEKDYTGACTLHVQSKCHLDKAPCKLVKPNDYFNVARICPRQLTEVDIEDIMKELKESDYDFGNEEFFK